MPFAGTPTELLLLECRLTELFDVVDHFVIVESPMDHQGNPKPYNYLANQDRFLKWADKIHYIQWEEMPSFESDPWDWAREHAQREGIGKGLLDLDAGPDDVIFQSDLDEIPRPLVVRNVKPKAFEKISLQETGHFWAIDWLYPEIWSGTVITRYETLCEAAKQTSEPFTWMRESRIRNAKQLPDGGWHFSWLGRAEAAIQKVNSFCHPNVKPDVMRDPEWMWREGYHFAPAVPGSFVKLKPVDVDKRWPVWMQDRANVPDSWYRPREDH